MFVQQLIQDKMKETSKLSITGIMVADGFPSQNSSNAYGHSYDILVAFQVFEHCKDEDINEFIIRNDIRHAYMRHIYVWWN